MKNVSSALRGQCGTAVLIHGLWMTPLSWRHWIAHYHERGMEVLAPAWPGLDAGIAELRSHPEAIAHLEFDGIVAHYERVVAALERPPIIIGHSFGALIAQTLVDRGYGAAAVAIATAPPKGLLFLPFSTLRSSWPTNTLTHEESQRIYDQQAVPGPNHLLFQAALANFMPHAATAIDFHNGERVPLLLIAGEKDHVAPPALVKATQRLYRKSSARTDYEEFAGRTHYILGQEGWQEVADVALAWAFSARKSAACMRA